MPVHITSIQIEERREKQQQQHSTQNACRKVNEKKVENIEECIQYNVQFYNKYITEICRGTSISIPSIDFWVATCILIY